jgi:hypothetical protein
MKSAFWYTGQLFRKFFTSMLMGIAITPMIELFVWFAVNFISRRNGGGGTKPYIGVLKT